MKIPNDNKQWQQSNSSDLFGNVYTTKNVSFDDDGYLKLSPTTIAIDSEENDADFEQGTVFAYSNVGYFFQNWGRPYYLSGVEEAPTKITATDYPGGSIYGDAVYFDGKLCVSSSTRLNYLSGGFWTETDISLTNSRQHPLINFISQRAIAIGNDNKVLLYDNMSATPVLTQTLTIASDYEVTSLAYINQEIYIGTRHKNGGRAVMYVWNGFGASAVGYETDSHIIHDITDYQGTIVLLSGSGALLQFNGAGFRNLAEFPIYHTPFHLSDPANFNIYKNSLKSNGDVLYISFSYTATSDIWLNQPSGVWCYDPKAGLYNKYSFTTSKAIYSGAILTSAVNTDDDTITVTSAPITGTEATYHTGGLTAIAGLTNEQTYYTIKVDATTIKLATSLANAMEGTAIDLTGTGNNSQRFVFFPRVDYGQFQTRRPMAILPLIAPTTDPDYAFDLYWSAEAYDRDGDTVYSFTGTALENLYSRGYFVSPKSFSQEVNDTFKNLVLKYSPLNEGDEIIIKYRTIDDGLDRINRNDIANWNVTWTSSTTFQTSNAVWAGANVGDEVEVLRGAGAGLLAHITEKTQVSGTYTITLDDSFDNYASNDIAIAIFRNWRKLMSITENGQGFVSRGLPSAKGKFIQVKVELRGKGTRIEELLVDDISLLPATR